MVPSVEQLVRLAEEVAAAAAAPGRVKYEVETGAGLSIAVKAKAQRVTDRMNVEHTAPWMHSMVGSTPQALASAEAGDLVLVTAEAEAMKTLMSFF